MKFIEKLHRRGMSICDPEAMNMEKFNHCTRKRIYGMMVVATLSIVSLL